MGRVTKTTFSILGALAVSTAVQAPLAAQDYYDPPAAEEARRVSQRELDALLAPIALYPDQLLAPLLMAATHPHDVEAAASWASRPINASLRGDSLAFAIEPFAWDPSVKTLAQFPDILRMMNDEWDWMVRVGNAFYLQETDVMDSVQRLRHQAFAMGTLRSNEFQRVRFEAGAVVIDMIDPGTVYIPTYDPVRVYGYWSYPEFPPYYFHRPIRVTRYAVVPTLWGWSSWEWHRHRIRVDLPRYQYFRRTNPWRFDDDTWRHDRRGRDINFRRDDPRNGWRDRGPERGPERGPWREPDRQWRGNDGDRRDDGRREWDRRDRNDGPRGEGRRGEAERPRDDRRAGIAPPDISPPNVAPPEQPSAPAAQPPAQIGRPYIQQPTIGTQYRERRWGGEGQRPRFNGEGAEGGRPFQPRQRDRQAYAGPQLTPPAPVAPLVPMPAPVPDAAPQAAPETQARAFRGGERRPRFDGMQRGDGMPRGEGRMRGGGDGGGGGGGDPGRQMRRNPANGGQPSQGTDNPRDHE